MLRCLAYILLFVLTTSGASAQKFIPITWVESIKDDFSFTQQWEYPEGVYVNQYGQVDYDYADEFEPADMKELDGKVIIDSMGAFYKYVDTTHKYHTMQSQANFSEWAGSNYVFADRVDKDFVKCYAPYNVASHCELRFVLADSICQAVVTLHSVTDTIIEYKANGGYFIIEKPAYDKRILKAKYYLAFTDADKPRYWQGLIYVPMTSD